MTEQEAIKEIKRWSGILMSGGKECTEVTAEAQNMAVQALEDIQKYQAIGTVEECRTAREMQTPKKPRENEIRGGFLGKIKHYTCQTCGNCLLTEMMNERQNTSHCWDCGQAIDWSVVD